MFAPVMTAISRCRRAELEGDNRLRCQRSFRPEWRRVAALLGPNRQRSATRARSVTVLLLRARAHLTGSEIARIFGRTRQSASLPVAQPSRHVVLWPNWPGERSDGPPGG